MGSDTRTMVGGIPIMVKDIPTSARGVPTMDFGFDDCFFGRQGRCYTFQSCREPSALSAAWFERPPPILKWIEFTIHLRRICLQHELSSRCRLSCIY